MSKKLNLTIEPQKCSEWCWAAVTTAIGRVFEDDQCPAEQCALVNEVVVEAGKDCCTECNCQKDPFDPCNKPKNLAVALNHCHFDRDGPAGISSLSFEDVKGEIDDGHPIAVSIKVVNDAAAISHAVVIFGYSDDGKVNVADPMQAGSQLSVSLAELVAGKSSQLDGTWEAAFRTKRRDE
jgi:hypothetical protein